jgi:hypothetical protein
MVFQRIAPVTSSYRRMKSIHMNRKRFCTESKRITSIGRGGVLGSELEDEECGMRNVEFGMSWLEKLKEEF